MTAETDLAIGTKLPIIFSYRDALFGNNFVVEVHAVNGRALCARDEDGFWMYGVNPGGMSARGDDIESAHAAFRQMFSDILKDLATDASGLDEFRTLVRTFFDDTNVGFEPDWLEAVRAIRNHEINPGTDIPRGSADAPRQITVEVKQIFKAEDNEAELQPALAA